MEKSTLRDKIEHELDFISDHWVKGDDRPPFNFGGWREECIESILQAIKEYGEELIGEDEERTENTIIADLNSTLDIVGLEGVIAKCRNQFRQEQREELKEDLGE